MQRNLEKQQNPTCHICKSPGKLTRAEHPENYNLSIGFFTLFQQLLEPSLGSTMEGGRARKAGTQHCPQPPELKEL